METDSLEGKVVIMAHLWQHFWVPAFLEVVTYYDKEPYSWEEVAERAPILYRFLEKLADAWQESPT